MPTLTTVCKNFLLMEGSASCFLFSIDSAVNKLSSGDTSSIAVEVEFIGVETIMSGESCSGKMPSPSSVLTLIIGESSMGFSPKSVAFTFEKDAG